VKFDVQPKLVTAGCALLLFLKLLVAWWIAIRGGILQAML